MMKTITLLSIVLLGLAVANDDVVQPAAAPDQHQFQALAANAPPANLNPIGANTPNFSPLEASGQAPNFAPLEAGAAAPAAAAGDDKQKKFQALQWGPYWGGGWGWGYRRFRAWGPWGFGGYGAGFYPWGGAWGGAWGGGYPYWY